MARPLYIFYSVRKHRMHLWRWREQEISNTGTHKINNFLKQRFKVKWISMKEVFIIDRHINIKRNIILYYEENKPESISEVCNKK